MSKNLAEPSTQRILAGHGYHITQLERRPAPDPGITGAPWPTSYYINLFNGFCMNRYMLGWEFVDDNPNANYPVNRAVWNNYRLRFGNTTTTTRTATDGDYWTFGARLGPQNAQWFLGGTFLLGPDFGNINIDFYGPVTENENGELTPDVDEVENDGAWIWMDTQSGGPWLQGYQAAETSDQSCDPAFAPTGNPGTLATTYIGPFDPGQDYSTDGGPGIYYFKMRVDGKHISSTGYKAAVADLWLVRGSRLNTDGMYLG